MPLKRPLRELQKTTGTFGLLFLTLIAVVLMAPFVAGPTPDSHPLLLDLVYAAIPVAALFAVRKHRHALVIGLVVGVPTVIAALQGRLSFTIFPPPWGVIIGAAFYSFASLQIVKYLKDHDEVTTDTIFGALSFYLLVGIIFMNGYIVVEYYIPGSFYVSEAQNPDGVLNAGEFLYFSYVTLTTLGYGDITPLSPHARSLAIVESIFGVMFMAVVIGRVVGIYKGKKPDYSDE